jgi:CheY-like chemotaxis protein
MDHEADMTHPTLLVVDDDPSIRRLLNQVLCIDYDVVEAASGEEAVELLETTTVDGAVVDVMMPGMDGFELVSHIRGQPDLAELPLVMLTALDDPQHRQRARDLGVDSYITKPFEIELLEATLNLLVEVPVRARGGSLRR